MDSFTDNDFSDALDCITDQQYETMMDETDDARSVILPEPSLELARELFMLAFEETTLVRIDVTSRDPVLLVTPPGSDRIDPEKWMLAPVYRPPSPGKFRLRVGLETVTCEVPDVITPQIFTYASENLFDIFEMHGVTTVVAKDSNIHEGYLRAEPKFFGHMNVAPWDLAHAVNAYVNNDETEFCDRSYECPFGPWFTRNAGPDWHLRKENIHQWNVQKLRNDYQNFSKHVKLAFAMGFYNTPVLDILVEAATTRRYNMTKPAVREYGGSTPFTFAQLFCVYFKTCINIWTTIALLSCLVLVGFSALTVLLLPHFYLLQNRLDRRFRIHMYGGGDDKKPKTAPGKQQRAPITHTPAKTSNFKDQVSDKDKIERAKRESRSRVQGIVAAEGFPFVVSTSDPVFEYYNHEKKQTMTPDIVYTVYDPNEINGIRKVVHGEQTCLYDCMLALYLGSCRIMNFDEYGEAVDKFKAALFQATHLQYQMQNPNYIGYLKGELLPCDDLIDPVCNLLSVRMCRLGVTTKLINPDYVKEYGTGLFSVYGAANYCKGRPFPTGVAGMIYKLPDRPHFSLVVGLKVHASGSLNEFCGTTHLASDIIACYDSPDLSKATPFYGFGLWCERKIEGLAGPKMPEVIVASKIEPVPRVKDLGLTKEKRLNNVINRALTDHQFTVRIGKLSYSVTTELDNTVGNVISQLTGPQGVLAGKEVTCGAKYDDVIRKYRVLTLSEIIRNPIVPKQQVQDTPIIETKNEQPIDFDPVNNNSEDPSEYLTFESTGRLNHIVMFDLKLENWLRDPMLVDGVFESHMRSKIKDEPWYNDNCGIEWTLILGDKTYPRGEYSDDFIPPDATINDLLPFIHTFSLTSGLDPEVDELLVGKLDVVEKEETEKEIVPENIILNAPRTFVEKRYKGIGATVYWKRTVPKFVMAEKRDYNKFVSGFIEVFHGSTAAVLFESKFARAFIERYSTSGFFDRMLTSFKHFQAAVNTPDNHRLMLEILLQNKVTFGDYCMQFNEDFFSTMPGTSVLRRKIENSLTYRYAHTVRCDDVYFYARPVNQITDTLIIAHALKTEYNEMDFNDPAALSEFFFDVLPLLKQVCIPRIFEGKIVKRILPWDELKLHEKILFLGAFSSGHKRVDSTMYVALNMMTQLASPKVLVGCSDYAAVDQRVNANSANMIAKFHISDFAEYVDVNISTNSVLAAKCIGYSYVERSNNVQPIVDFVDKELCYPNVVKTDLELPVLYGAGLVNNVCYNIIGYRSRQKKMKPPGPVVKNFKLTGSRESGLVGNIVGITNYNVKGCLAPIPDLNDTDNIKEGLIKRIGAAVPEPNEGFKVCFPAYVRHWCNYFDLRGCITEMLIEEVKQMQDWEEYKKTLRYSPARLRQLDRVRKEVESLGTFEFAKNEEGRWLEYQWTKVEAHVKWESYNSEYKYVRMIFARMDHFKVFFGPYSKLIQKALYRKLPHFVTDKPVRSLAYFLWEALSRFPLIFSTDFSMFESHNYPWLMHNGVDVVLIYMHGYDLDTELAYELDKLASRNIIENKYASTQVDAKVMSGETLTTVFNTVTNILVISYIVECEGLVYGTGFFFTNSKMYRCYFVGIRRPDTGYEFVLFCAGDDGIFGLPMLSWVDYDIFADDKYLEKYGVKLKISKQSSVSGSGFLSKYYSEFDFVTLCDPFKQLSKGILSPKYMKCKPGVKKALARMRALSLKYEFGNCPVVGAYADCILRCTKNVKITKALVYLQSDDPFKSDYYEEAVAWYEANVVEKKNYSVDDRQVGFDSRMVIEDLFGIPIPTQIDMEAYFDSVDTTMFPLEFNVPCIDLVVSEDNEDFYYDYCTTRVDDSVRQLDADNGLFPVRPVVEPVHVLTDWFDFINRSCVVIPYCDEDGSPCDADLRPFIDPISYPVAAY